MSGTFAPVTLDGAIVVDGILASSSASYEGVFGSFFPTLYLGKRSPPMMVHHALMALAYKLFGQFGLSLLDVINAPLFWAAGVEQSTNAAVAAKFSSGTVAAPMPKPAVAVFTVAAAVVIQSHLRTSARRS